MHRAHVALCLVSHLRGPPSPLLPRRVVLFTDVCGDLSRGATSGNGNAKGHGETLRTSTATCASALAACRTYVHADCDCV